MVGNHYARRPTPLTLALSESDTEALKKIRAEYARAGSMLDKDSRNVDRARSGLIQQANPYAEQLAPNVFRKVLFEISSQSGRHGGYTIAKDAFDRACAKQSLGPEGIVPASYLPLLAHIAAACRIIDELVYVRR
jgi:hypothetical protein